MVEKSDDSTREWVKEYLDSSKHIVSLIDTITYPLNIGYSKSLRLLEIKHAVDSHGGISIEDYWNKANRKDVILADLVTLYKIKNAVKITHTTNESWFGEQRTTTKDSLDAFYD